MDDMMNQQPEEGHQQPEDNRMNQQVPGAYGMPAQPMSAPEEHAQMHEPMVEKPFAQDDHADHAHTQAESHYTAPQAVPGQLSAEDKVFAGLSYVSILFVVPIILKHDDPLVHFHAKQGMLLFGAEVVVWFVLFLLESFISALSPSNTLGIVAGLGGLAWLFFVAISLAAIYFIFRDKKWEIPFLSKLAAKVSI